MIEQLEDSHFILCDTGFLSRKLAKIPIYEEAYQRLIDQRWVPVISSAVYVELQYWLIQQRGQQQEALSRSLFDRGRNWLDKALVLPVAEADELVIEIGRKFPDTGLGDTFTIAVALFYDMDVFTLNPKHFTRVPGIRLYEPPNYKILVANA